MKPNRTYVWYRQDEEGRIAGVGTVLLPQLGVSPNFAAAEAHGNRFELQIVEADLSQHADVDAIHEKFRVVNGTLRPRSGSSSAS